MLKIIRQIGIALKIWPKPALNGLDDKLAPYLTRRGEYFIEVGGNDGYSQSNTYYLEKRKQWSGLLVEAIPKLAQECRRKRTKSTVINCALVGRDYVEPTATVRYAGLMSLVPGSRGDESKDSAHIERGLRIQNLTESYVVQVGARTLVDVLDEIGAPTDIEFFSLDVEGFELQVLKGMDFDRYHVKYLLIEERNHDEISNHLAPWYDELERLTHHDFLYLRKSRT